MATLHLFGRAFVRGAIEEDTLVSIDRGRIVDVVQTTTPTREAVKVRGLIAPGFVDLHIHGGDGADFMDASPEANRRILACHALHGTTALMATTLSASREDLHAAVAAIHVTQHERPAAVSEIVGIHLEGPYINREKAGAQDRASIRPADPDEVSSLLALAPTVRWMMTIAPEAEGAQYLIERFRDRIVFSVGHTSADYHQTVAALAWGARHFTHLFNAMTGLGHRAPGVVGAALVSADATAELIADGVHVHPAAIRVAVSSMPHRIALITDAMRACGLGDGTYSLYEHHVEVSGGAARLIDGTLAGSVLTMHDAVRNMVEVAGLPIELVLPFATDVPARVIDLAQRKGRIAVGNDADIVVLDDRLGLDHVFVRGVEVE